MVIFDNNKIKIKLLPKRKKNKNCFTKLVCTQNNAIKKEIETQKQNVLNDKLKNVHSRQGTQN